MSREAAWAGRGPSAAAEMEARTTRPTAASMPTLAASEPAPGASMPTLAASQPALATGQQPPTKTIGRDCLPPVRIDPTVCGATALRFRRYSPDFPRCRARVGALPVLGGATPLPGRSGFAGAAFLFSIVRPLFSSTAVPADP